VIHWIAVGVAVLATILGLSLWLNRKKSTAHLSIRLAEAYRQAGDFETARELYEIAPDLDQNVDQAREGQRRAREEVRRPVLSEALVAAARRRLTQEREEVQTHLEREGIEVDLPPLQRRG
jgi:tetratricopeptide (TPR) repeat protein